MATKYIARLNGKVVGKRTTQNRTYTHAIVVQRLEGCARDQAYNRSADQIEQDRKNHAFYAQRATGTYVGTFADGRTYTSKVEGTELTRAQASAALTVEQYIEAQRQIAIGRFEQALKDGHYEPFVAAWAGRLDLAQKAVGQHTGVWCKLVAIVSAEEA